MKVLGGTKELQLSRIRNCRNCRRYRNAVLIRMMTRMMRRGQRRARSPMRGRRSRRPWGTTEAIVSLPLSENTGRSRHTGFQAKSCPQTTRGSSSTSRLIEWTFLMRANWSRHRSGWVSGVPSPTGLRKASKMIFNPTWTPPNSFSVKGKIGPGEKDEAGAIEIHFGQSSTDRASVAYFSEAFSRATSWRFCFARVRWIDESAG